MCVALHWSENRNPSWKSGKTLLEQDSIDRLRKLGGPLLKSFICTFVCTGNVLDLAQVKAQTRENLATGSSIVDGITKCSGQRSFIARVEHSSDLLRFGDEVTRHTASLSRRLGSARGLGEA